MTAVTSLAEKERRGGTCTPKSCKAKLERLRSARLTRRDQVVRLLDMPRVLKRKKLKFQMGFEIKIQGTNPTSNLLEF
jgi:hypothetical protein